MSAVAEAIEVEVVTPESKAAMVVKTSGLDVAEIQPLQASFAPLFTEARTILEQSKAVQVTDASQELQMKLSRTYRLALRKVRTGADALRKDLKEASIRRGRAIDGFFNILLDMTEAEEARLAAGEQFAERKELERRNRLNVERAAALAAYGLQLVGLGDMEEATFAQLLENTKAGHEAKQEAARKAEAARIEAENLRLAEEARVRAENEKLKAEAAAAAEAARIEREKIEAAAAAERKKAAAKAKAEREAIEAKAKAELDAAEAIRARQAALAEEMRQKTEKARAAAESQAHADRMARLAAEAEAQALRDAEAKRIADEAEAARQAALAPDKEKLQALAVELRAFGMPALATKDGQGVVELLSAKLDKLAAWIDEEANAL